MKTDINTTEKNKINSTKQSGFNIFNIIPDVNMEIIEKLVELKPEQYYKLNDMGNGELFADVYKNKCRYNRTANEWYVYNGKIWERDVGSMEVSRLAKTLSDALQCYALTIEDEDVKQKYRNYILKLGVLRNRKVMIEDARDKYFIDNDMLDKDLYLLNCQNCVIDLRTFKTMEHDPDLLLSK